MSEENQAGRFIGFTKDGLVAVPAIVDAEHTAKMLGLSVADIRILVSRKMLKPLGKPAQQAPKLFLTSEIQELAQNRAWMDKAVQVHYEYWKGKNSRKTANLPTEETPNEPLPMAA